VYVFLFFSSGKREGNIRWLADINERLSAIYAFRLETGVRFARVLNQDIVNVIDNL